MSSVLYLGIDQGSTSTKGVLLDEAGLSVADFQVPSPPRHEDGRVVEQDGEGILTSVVEVFLKAKQWAHEHDGGIRAAGLAAQRSGVLAWRAIDGIPLHPMITWADTRTFPIIENFGPGDERISAVTGLPTIPNFAAGKFHLLQRRFLEPSIKVGTLDSFLLYRLTGREVFVTEEAMAARTMLYSLREASWSDQLCREFRVDRQRLPAIRPSVFEYGKFEGIPLVAMLGDQQAAVFGRSDGGRCALLNLGTIASLLVETGERIVQKPGLMTTVLFSMKERGSNQDLRRYLIETTSAITGTVLMEPIRRGWCATSHELHQMCEASFAANPAGRAIAYFVHHRPSPPWYPQRTPNVVVAQPEASTADRARAVVENVGNLVVRLIEEFQDKGLLGAETINEVAVTGGGSELDYLLQYIADVSDKTLHRMPTREATARGAALAAMVGDGADVTSVRGLLVESPQATYTPRTSDRRRRYMMWQKLERDLFNNALPTHAEREE